MKKAFRMLCVFSLVFCLFSSYGLAQEGKEVNKININTATVEQLAGLPGIGDEIAKRVVEYREKTPFKTIEDIKNVKGIGEKTFERMKDLITVGGEAAPAPKSPK